ncbi:LysM peptidoglycan-binding domain-containing protein [Actinomadura spongiicola]|uniref:LysM peptidoglycan-binding domain-containing protein n=1 Tax=Actinomadura spongiicola TaxID=2303421 RepID=A0A372GLL6_9ACTN|nr:BTAD domain-containing putative transcriptional regulator [Actinomadura spongiicola]RFS85953.1 LysM peptidoglycan-binding domain-containing protein [Actinomadura spongiicola]
MTVAPPTRITEILRGFCALLICAVLLVGVPIGLYAVAGSPLPDHVPSWEQVTATLMRPDTGNRLFLSVVRLLGWSAWVVFTIATCTEAVGCLAGHTAPALPRPVRPAQQLARDLLAAITLIFSSATVLTTPASAATQVVTADTPPTDGPSTSPSRSPEWEPLLGDDTPPTPPPEQPAGRTQIVHRGDTLWSLARRAYGSGGRYTKIFAASRTIDQPPGVPALTDPDEISPGQRIRLPPARTNIEDPPPERGSHSERLPTSERHRSYDRPTHAPREGRGTPGNRPSEVPAPVVASPVENPPSTPVPTTARSGNPNNPGITLPSGSHIGIGLAAALSLAVAATRLHRRRQYRNSAQDAPADQPAPAPVAQARKAHLDRTYAAHDAPVPSDADLIALDRTTPPPDSITLGTRDNTTITLPFAGLTLGLTGDGAHAAARAITTELLAKAPRDRAELLIPQPDADTLFPGTALDGIPGLTLTPTCSTAIPELEAEIAHRAQLMEAADQPDLIALRATDPAEPLPTLLLTATVPDPTPGALQAVTHLGHRYGFGTLILGPAPTGTTLHLTEDSTVTRAEGPFADTLTGAHLFHLTSDDANAMLHTLRTAIGAPEPETSTAPPPTPRPATTRATTHSENASTETLTLAPTGQDQTRPIRLQVLGPVRLHTTDGPITTGVRRSARDLLAYLATEPRGITREQAITALWPDHQPDAATNAFNTAVANIRKTLRTATGVREPMYLIRTAGRYHLDPSYIDVDQQHLNTALTQARHADTDTARIDALKRIADLYTAEFAADLTYDWVENHREHLRRAVIEALTRLAQLLRHSHPEQALAALEQAITHDPYAEPLYQSIMKIETDLGRLDAARRTYQLLTLHLANIDTEPDDRTHKLLTDLPSQGR